MYNGFFECAWQIGRSCQVKIVVYLWNICFSWEESENGSKEGGGAFSQGYTLLYDYKVLVLSKMNEWFISEAFRQLKFQISNSKACLSVKNIVGELTYSAIPPLYGTWWIYFFPLRVDCFAQGRVVICFLMLQEWFRSVCFSCSSHCLP